LVGNRTHVMPVPFEDFLAPKTEVFVEFDLQTGQAPLVIST
jgi:hypothetical protein